MVKRYLRTDSVDSKNGNIGYVPNFDISNNGMLYHIAGTSESGTSIRVGQTLSRPGSDDFPAISFSELGELDFEGNSCITAMDHLQDNYFVASGYDGVSYKNHIFSIKNFDTSRNFWN